MFITRSTFKALGGEALVLTTAQFSALLISFIGTILVTRALGPESRGVYAWVLTLQGMTVQLATLVTYPAVRKLAAEQPLSQSGPLAGTIAALTLCGSLLIIPPYIYGWFEPKIGLQAHKLLLVTMLLIPASSLASSFSALVHSRNQAKHTLANLIIPRLTMLAHILVFLALGVLNLGSAVWVAQIPILLGLGLTLSTLPIPLRACIPNLTLAKRLLHFLGASWISGLTLFALPKLALFRMGQLSTLAETGHFSIATTLMEVALILPFSFGYVLTSHISRKNSQNEPASFWAHTRLMTLGMTALCIIGGLLAGKMLPLLFGPAFGASVTPFLWLLPSIVLATFHQGLNSHLFSHGPKTALWIPPLTACCTCLTAAQVLIPTHGSTGAAWATGLGYIVLVATTLTLMQYPHGKKQ